MQWLVTAPKDLRELLDLELLRECPGVYQLLVSPDSGVRCVRVLSCASALETSD